MTTPGLRNKKGEKIGFDYLVDLGVNVVHLMPLQEFLHFPDDEWRAVFRDTMARVLPDQPIVDVTDADSVRNCLYTIADKDLTFIPGSRHLRRGPGREFIIEPPPGADPAWRGIYDRNNNMLVLVQYNMDVADAWEFADWPEYPEHKTTLAYRYGINAIIYSMTH